MLWSFRLPAPRLVELAHHTGAVAVEAALARAVGDVREELKAAARDMDINAVVLGR